MQSATSPDLSLLETRFKHPYVKPGTVIGTVICQARHRYSFGEGIDKQVDLGIEHAIKPAARENMLKSILYV